MSDSILIAVGGDMDGHFFAVRLDDRQGFLDIVMHPEQSPNYYDVNDFKKYPENLDLETLSEAEWLNFCKQFTQRGSLGIISV